MAESSVVPSTLESELCSKARLVAEKLAADYPEIQAIFLFGSVAQGSCSPLSDIDVGVVLPSESKINVFDLHTALAIAGLEQNVDIVIVPRENVLLRHEVTKCNRLLYKTVDFDSTAYVVAALRDYEDHRPLFDIQRRSLKRAIESRYGNGEE
jgi:uncharacterized protein